MCTCVCVLDEYERKRCVCLGGGGITDGATRRPQQSRFRSRRAAYAASYACRFKWCEQRQTNIAFEGLTNIGFDETQSKTPQKQKKVNKKNLVFNLGVTSVFFSPHIIRMIASDSSGVRWRGALEGKLGSCESLWLGALFLARRRQTFVLITTRTKLFCELLWLCITLAVCSVSDVAPVYLLWVKYVSVV